MLHHVSIEVEPAKVEACAACWLLLGFELVEVPEALGPYFTWLEREGTQIHLIHTEAPAVPSLGHPAVVVEDFEATFAALEEAGHEPERHRELWGEPRAFVTMPGGHRVEFMAAPPRPRHEAPFIAVTGSIATGKTGLVKRLAATFGAAALHENVDENPYFDRFYADPSRWAFHSQVAFATDALSRQASAATAGAVVQDRTVYEAVDVFGRLLLETGRLTAEDFRTLSEIRACADRLPRKPNLLIHLRAPASILLERIEDRGRPAERSLSRDYLERLGEHYEGFVGEWNASPVIIVDTTERDLRVAGEYEALVEELRSLQEG